MLKKKQTKKDRIEELASKDIKFIITTTGDHMHQEIDGNTVAFLKAFENAMIQDEDIYTLFKTAVRFHEFRKRKRWQVG